MIERWAGRFLRAVALLAPFVGSTVACESSSDSADENASSDSAIVIHNPTLTMDLSRGSIEPPKSDAVLVTPHTPLRNGKDIIKKRWLWLPPGTKITVDASGDVHVPTGTSVWKEFYVASRGTEKLIERRQIKKTKDTGSFDDWEFGIARKGIAGEDQAIGAVVTDVSDLGQFALDPNKPAPLNTSKWETTIRVGGQAKFVFPGQRLCVGCHAGISTMYPGSRTVMAFSVQTASLTKESRDALLAKGYVDNDAVAAFAKSAPKFEEMTKTRKLLAELRTNCVTCHSDSPDSFGNLTGFKLDPKKDYQSAELVAALSQESFEGSTLLENIPLHLRGQRSYMPPPAGGVPTLPSGQIDSERAALLEAFTAWKSSAGR